MSLITNESETQEIDEDLQNIQEKGNCCHWKCLERIGHNEIYEHILSMRDVSKEEKEMYIMGKLKTKGTGSKTESEGKRKRYIYSFDDREVCKEVFLLAHDIGEKILKNLVKHLKENGPVPRQHGNRGKRPHHALSFEDVKSIVKFIVSYADDEGLPLPAVPHANDGDAPILLPASTTKCGMHEKYKEGCLQIGDRAAGLSVFKNVWQSCVPHIQISTPRTDVCATCEKLRSRVVSAVTEREKIDALQSFQEHVQIAQDEHKVYIEMVKLARDEFNSSGLQLPLGTCIAGPCCNDAFNVHYTFDFAQNITIPHHARQEGQLYFTSPRRVQLFGVCIEGAGSQINYLIDENKTIGKDGANTHGPNTVLTLLHHALSHYSFGENACNMHCDNCFGQNKNRFTLAYLCWRVMTGRHREITLNMQVPGHTKCLVDAGFSYVRKLYRRKDNDNIRDLKETVEKSSSGNKVVEVNDSIPWQDWKTFLGDKFKALKGIRKFHHFRFSALHPGIVFCKTKPNDEETAVSLFSAEDTYIQGLPRHLLPGGLSRERQQYLYRHIRPFVRDDAKDDTCPPPAEE
ncbi:hypothetical protein FSP39_014609 [Pinctada imbricata]|uniref:DUF7869 domain-containing protein n=1 Tax=Pinctada imbricata TaxID=66713 RepID=A0AA89BIW1_PINIB|nr:hypothetical protein FSP39_014609 [Pinctada imbricata]